MKRNTVLGVVAALALAGAAVIFFALQPPVELSEDMSWYVVDLAADGNPEMELLVARDAKPPFLNKATGEYSLYPLYFSYDSGKLFVPNLSRNTASGRLEYDVPVVCPETGSQNVSPANPKFPDLMFSDERSAYPEWQP